MPRKLMWIATETFNGFGCSECGWRFKPLGPLVGSSIGEMKQKFEAQRDEEFKAHVCAKYSKKAKP
jgi:hypothetical protein